MTNRQQFEIVIDRDNEQTAMILRAFLNRPLHKRNFDRFFKFCCSEVLIYLRFLRASGWRLPEDQVQSENAHQDIACDILGAFLTSERNRPFYVIFDYLKRHHVSVEEIPSDQLVKHIQFLIRGFTRKELTLLRGLMDPQIRNLKRRLNDILASDEYASVLCIGDREESVYLLRNAKNLRSDCSVIPRDALDQIVRGAYQVSLARSKWCAGIFELLNEQTEFRNAIQRSLLISVCVAVNAEVADASGLVTGHIPTPTEEHLRKKVALALETTLEWLDSTVLARFVARGRLSTKDAPYVLTACCTYLQDLIQDGDTDKIPRYLMALRPDLSQADYQDRYKYVMDTAARRGLERLRWQLKQDPTIWPFGGYLPDEE